MALFRPAAIHFRSASGGVGFQKGVLRGSSLRLLSEPFKDASNRTPAREVVHVR
jgi:hypothetical protein